MDKEYHKTMLIYVNGVLCAFAPQSGNIRTTTLPLLIGQMLLTDAQYNFKGVMDDGRIYDDAISPETVLALYNPETSNVTELSEWDDIQISPNPVSQFLTIQSPSQNQFSEVVITDLSGKNILSLYEWKTENPLGVSQLLQGIYFLSLKQGSFSKSSQFL